MSISKVYEVQCVSCMQWRLVTTNWRKSIGDYCRSCSMKQMDPSRKARGVKHAMFTHGQTNSRLHTVWENMLARCRPSKSENWMRNWYERGIRVCPEWQLSFILFAEWARESGYQPELTLDRKDNDGDYSPGNCRWATHKEQQANRRPSHLWKQRD